MYAPTSRRAATAAASTRLTPPSTLTCDVAVSLRPAPRPRLLRPRGPPSNTPGACSDLRRCYVSATQGTLGAKSQPSPEQSQRSKQLQASMVDAIKASGPIPVSSFMKLCLQHPELGYYTRAQDSRPDTETATDASSASSETHHVLGSRGDFVTSPEISQVFGELLAIYLITRWQAFGNPSRLRLVELGPGKGTLLSDVLRTFSKFSGILQALVEVELVELSPGLRKAQREAVQDTLAKYAPRKRAAFVDDSGGGPSQQGTGTSEELRVVWRDEVRDLSLRTDVFTMVLAHEFLDALPIRVFEKTTQGFREVLVGLKEQMSAGQDGKKQSGVTTLKASDLVASSSSSSSSPPSPRQTSPFGLTLSPASTPLSSLLASSNRRFSHLQPGQRVEVSPDVWTVSRHLAEIVSPVASEQGPVGGGTALVIDYGGEKAFGSSWRAFKSHRLADPLSEPGDADQTANVDFALVKEAVATLPSALAHGPLAQSTFLTSLGLAPRLHTLLRAAPTPQRRAQLQSAADRLVDARGMGAQYKALAIEPPVAAASPELAAAGAAGGRQAPREAGAPRAKSESEARADGPGASEGARDDAAPESDAAAAEGEAPRAAAAARAKVYPFET